MYARHVIIYSPFWCRVYHSSDRWPKVGWKETNTLTLHAREHRIEGHQPDLSSALRTLLQRGLGYQEQEICDTGMGQPAITPDLHLDLSDFGNKYSLLRTFLPLWFDPKVGTLQTVGLEKTETSRQIELCSLVSSRLHSWFG